MRLVRYRAVAPPSTVGLVAKITSEILSPFNRSINSFTLISSRPIPSKGESVPCSTWYLLELDDVLDRQEIIWALHNAEDLCSDDRPTDPAWVLICQIETDGAEMDLFLHFQDRLRQFLGIRETASEDMEG
jgi:hypothetical protein